MRIFIQSHVHQAIILNYRFSSYYVPPEYPIKSYSDCSFSVAGPILQVTRGDRKAAYREQDEFFSRNSPIYDIVLQLIEQVQCLNKHSNPTVALT